MAVVGILWMASTAPAEGDNSSIKLYRNKKRVLLSNDHLHHRLLCGLLEKLSDEERKIALCIWQLLKNRRKKGSKPRKPFKKTKKTVDESNNDSEMQCVEESLDGGLGGKKGKAESKLEIEDENTLSRGDTDYEGDRKARYRQKKKKGKKGKKK
jgi:hypothetical protein